MTISLVDSGSGTSLELLGASESMSEAEADPDLFPYPNARSEENIIVTLSQSEVVTLTGTASAMRLARDGSWPDDPVEALAEWVARFEQFVNGGQGDGYTLTDDDRNRQFNVFVGNLSWDRYLGEKFEVDWSMQLIRGGVVDHDVSYSPQSTSPDDTMGITSVDGTTHVLPSPGEVRLERSQRFEYFPLPQFEDPDYDENEIVAIEGAVREVTIMGSIADDVQGRNEFDNEMREIIGGNNPVTLWLPFPGYAISGVVEHYDSIREAGHTRLGDYALTVIEGTLQEDGPEWPPENWPPDDPHEDDD